MYIPRAVAKTGIKLGRSVFRLSIPLLASCSPTSCSRVWDVISRPEKERRYKGHTVIHANEGVPSDIKFTSAATNNSFMLRPSALNKGDMIAMDRAYINYEKLETLTLGGVLYVTKMKRNLKYSVLEDCMYQTTDGFMEVRMQHVTFSKVLKGGETLTHHACIITYADTQKYKQVSSFTNDMESDPNEIIEIYRKRWEIELLFRLIK